LAIYFIVVDRGRTPPNYNT